MSNEDEVSRSFQVEVGALDEVRAILEARARLRFTETRRWFSPWVEFTVTGPAWAIDAVAEEIGDENVRASDRQQW